MSKRETAAAAILAAAAVAWIIWPRPVFTALVLAVVLVCFVDTFATAARAIRRSVKAGRK
jgi:Sec-independent protein secretion pathway component TatC